MSSVNARIKPEVKKKAERILSELEIKPSHAINMFYKQIILNNGLPFPVVIPEDETTYITGNVALMEQIQEGIKVFRDGKGIVNPEQVMDAIDTVQS